MTKARQDKLYCHCKQWCIATNINCHGSGSVLPGIFSSHLLVWFCIFGYFLDLLYDDDDYYLAGFSSFWFSSARIKSVFLCLRLCELFPVLLWKVVPHVSLSSIAPHVSLAQTLPAVSPSCFSFPDYFPVYISPVLSVASYPQLAVCFASMFPVFCLSAPSVVSSCVFYV